MSDDYNVWSIIGRGQRQRTGPIRGAQPSVHSSHNNRAGHRLYVKLNQPRQFRKNIMGFGRWRRGRRLTTGYETHAFSSGAERGPDRRTLRHAMVASAKAFRTAALKPGWRRP